MLLTAAGAASKATACSLDGGGHDSSCVDSGGEIRPGEDEEVLRPPASVRDADAVGPRAGCYGDSARSIVEAVTNEGPDLSPPQPHVSQLLADYKAPGRQVVADAVERTPSGKSARAASGACSELEFRPGNSAIAE